MTDLTTFDKIQQTLFDDPEDENAIQLSPKEIEIRDRYKKVFTYWLDKPYLMNSQIRRFMMFEMKLSRSQAYRDFPKIELLLANVKNASKEFVRYQVIQMSKEAYAMAKQQRNPMAMTMAIDKIGKFCKLDKDELDSIPWNEIQLPQYEPSADIKVLDPKLEDYSDAAREKIKKRYINRPKFEDAQIVD